MGKIETNVKDALDHVRAATQELHGAISDAVAKRGGATKADLEVFAQKAKAVTEFAKGSISTQHDAAKKHLAEAVTHLEATQKQVAESSEEFWSGIPDLGPKNPRRRARFRSEGQRSRCGETFGFIQANPEVGEYDAQLRCCGL